MLKVIKLKVGDIVRDHGGMTGRVEGFKIDGVRIRWSDGEHLYGDDELRMSGLMLVTTADAVRSRR